MTMRLACMLALLAGVAAGVGCGSSGTIPSGDARQLSSGLDRVGAAIDEGDCTTANSEIEQLRSEVSAIDVPTRLRNNLDEGLRKLDAAAASECKTADKPQTTETATVETTTVTVPTQETATTTPPTTTTPTTTTTTPTTPTVPTTTTTEPPTGGVPPGDEDGGELEP